MTEAIVLSDIAVRNWELTLLSGFDLRIEKGSLVVVLGEGGSGKTTIFKLLTGEIKPDIGDVRVGGEDVNSLHGNKLATFRRSIGIISQEMSLLANRTVEEQILLPLEIDGMNAARRHAQADAAIERFGLQRSRNRLPSSLSMSERQRAAIARAVVREPLVLLADEPAAHLDANDAIEIARLLLHENLRGMTVLIGTSDEHFASYFPEACICHMQALNAVLEH
jgi:cell division transport system ATP-binding protein